MTVIAGNGVPSGAATDKTYGNRGGKSIAVSENGSL
jgi:hypothetical protein